MTELFNPFTVSMEAMQKAQQAYWGHVMQSAAPEGAWLADQPKPIDQTENYNQESGDDLMHRLLEEVQYRTKLDDAKIASLRRTIAMQQELDEREAA